VFSEPGARSPEPAAPPSSLSSSLLPYPVLMLRSIRITLEMIKWEHSVFALPFASPQPCLPRTAGPPGRRSAGSSLHDLRPLRCHGFNRWPMPTSTPPIRATRMRAIPAGLLTRNFAAGFTVVMSRSSSSAPGASIASP